MANKASGALTIRRPSPKNTMRASAPIATFVVNSALWPNTDPDTARIAGSRWLPCALSVPGPTGEYAPIGKLAPAGEPYTSGWV